MGAPMVRRLLSLGYEVVVCDVNPQALETARAAGARLAASPHDVASQTAVVCTCLPSLDAVGISLYEALEKAGNRPVRALQRLRALLLSAEHAKLLNAREGDAGLLVERLGFLRDGRAVEFCQTYYRGDTYDFVAELSSPGG